MNHLPVFQRGQQGGERVLPFLQGGKVFQWVLAPHPQLFEELLTKYTIGDAIRPVTSFIDQRSIHSAREVKDEIVRNILTPLNFFQCLLYLENLGVTQILEVGPGDSLTKSSKFIEGNFRFQALSKGKVL
jgi:[acyl-carrier-protein] S-malonyltransferase